MARLPPPSGNGSKNVDFCFDLSCEQRPVPSALLLLKRTFEPPAKRGLLNDRLNPAPPSGG
jgi:hypothetical protein